MAVVVVILTWARDTLINASGSGGVEKVARSTGKLGRMYSSGWAVVTAGTWVIGVVCSAHWTVESWKMGAGGG